MNDATIIRLATETTRHLRHAIMVSPAPYMVPSYNALLAAAHANHPDDVFLKALRPLPAANGEPHRTEDVPLPAGDEAIVSVAEISALFAQLAIALESFQTPSPT